MKKCLFIFLVVILFSSCREEYQPPVVTSGKAYLVVEGFLNCGVDATTIRLTNTTGLSDALALQPVGGASLFVENKAGNRYPLYEQGGGSYSGASGSLRPGEQYRLLINLPDGRKYNSDYVVAKQTPPIDSISWRRNKDGVELSVSSHDPSNSTKYYRWDYVETWEIHSAFFAAYKYQNGKVLERDRVAENVFYCWRETPSSSILLGSTTSLDKDVVHMKPLLQIPNASEKLGVRYSLLVKQYAIDQKGYEFLQAMKKNTETLGSIFDAQPSEVRGNIHSATDGKEMVIGYITASSQTEKRIFIDAREVDPWGYTFFCGYTEVANHPDSFKKYYPMLQPYEAHWEGLSIIGYYSADPSCVDCTLRGVNRKPSYW